MKLVSDSFDTSDTSDAAEVAEGRDPFLLVERAWADAEMAAFVFDSQGRFRFANESFAQLVGWKPDPFYGRRPPLPWWEESEAGRTRRQLDAWVGGEMETLGVAGVQSLLRHRSGRLIEIVVTGTTLHGEEGGAVAFVGVAAEIGAGGDEPAAQAGLREAAEHLLKTAELVQRALLAGGADAGEARLARVPGVGTLSSREREVLRRLGDGLRVSTIAVDLAIRPATVRNHLKAIYRKTGLRSQAKLVSTLRLGR